MTLSTLFFSQTILANESPVVSTLCESGGEFGTHVQVKLKTGFEYKKLIIHRLPEGADYQRDLSSFRGGRYNLDLNKRQGIQGFSIEFKKSEDLEYEVFKGSFSCQDAPIQKSQEQDLTSQKSADEFDIKYSF